MRYFVPSFSSSALGVGDVSCGGLVERIGLSGLLDRGNSWIIRTITQSVMIGMHLAYRQSICKDRA